MVKRLSNLMPKCLEKIYKILQQAGYNPIIYINEVNNYATQKTYGHCNKILHNLYKLLVIKQYPLEYIIHTAYFYGFKFFIKEPVYIPNPFTERLLDRLLVWVITKNIHAPITATFIDIGTGTSAIISSLYMSLYNLSISKQNLNDFLLSVLSDTSTKRFWRLYTDLEIPTSRKALSQLRNNLEVTLHTSNFIATEIDDTALSVARYNINNLNLPIKLIKADVVYATQTIRFPIVSPPHEPLITARQLQKYVILMTNKPYLPRNSKLSESVKYQSSLSLYSSASFNKKLKLFINYLIKKNHRIELFMETLRTSNPLSAKIMHRSYFSN